MPNKCILKGRIVSTDGKGSTGVVAFVPERDAVVDGLMITRSPVKVVPDITTGRWSVGLYPSTYVGRYRMTCLEFVAWVEVPEADTAEVDQCLVPPLFP